MAFARLAAPLRRPRGTRADDLMLRAAGALALAAIAAALLVPVIVPLFPFVLYTIWTNGPHSPVLPASYEPVLMLYGRIYPPVLIGAVGTAATVFVEWINYHLYTRAADLRAVRKLQGGRLVGRLRRLFARHPFLTVWLCSITPLPYWVARVLAVLARYSKRRHLTATALGRFPKLWFIAALGEPLGLSIRWLGIASVAALALAGALWLVDRARRSLRQRGPAVPHVPVGPVGPVAAVGRVAAVVPVVQPISP